MLFFCIYFSVGAYTHNVVCTIFKLFSVDFVAGGGKKRKKKWHCFTLQAEKKKRSNEWISHEPINMPKHEKLAADILISPFHSIFSEVRHYPIHLSNENLHFSQ